MPFYTRLVTYLQTHAHLLQHPQPVADRSPREVVSAERMGQHVPNHPVHQPRYVKVIFEDMSDDASSTPPPDPHHGDIWRTRLGDREWSGVNWVSF